MQTQEIQRPSVLDTDKVVLHYIHKASIAFEIQDVALCGEVFVPQRSSSPTHGGKDESIICPDCILRYSLLK